MTRLRLILLALLLFGGPTAVPAASTDEGAAPPAAAYEAAMARGDALLAAGDDAGAEREFRAALQQGPEGEARAVALHRLGLSLAQQERFTEAEPPIAEAETIARTVRGGRSLMLADVLRAKTVVLYRTGRVEAARAAFREAKAILEGNADVWKTDEDGTTWRHTPSGWRFPVAGGPFARLSRTMLDDAGYNVAVHYRIGPASWGATLVTVYVSVARGVPLAEEFEATKLEIVREYPDSTLRRDGPAAAAGLDGYEVVLDLPPTDDGRVRRTSLAAFEKGAVTIRIRASYPAAEAEIRAPQVAALVETVLSSGP